MELNSTHPLTGKRVRALSTYAEQLGLPTEFDMGRVIGEGKSLSKSKLYGNFLLDVVLYGAETIGLSLKQREFDEPLPPNLPLLVGEGGETKKYLTPNPSPRRSEKSVACFSNETLREPVGCAGFRRTELFQTEGLGERSKQRWSNSR